MLVFGSLLSRLPQAAAPRHWLVWLGLAVAVIAGLVWLVAEAASMASAETLAELWQAAPIVAFETRFGRFLLLRTALLVLAAVCARAWRGAVPAATLAAAAVGLQAWTGHAAAIEGQAGDWLAATETLHLLAAGAWIGALPALLLTLVSATPADAERSARHFTWLGIPAVLVLAATGLVQAQPLVGGLPGLFGTAYGHIALLKIALFAAMVGLAALNRFSLVARKQALCVSVGIETAMGAAVLIAAAFLANDIPGAHATPDWPFGSRPNWAALNDWPVGLALAGTALAFLLAGWGLWRRRIAPFAVGIILAVLTLPHLAPLLTDAYPTSFAHPPDGFSTAAIAAGADAFAAHCASCHGTGGAGNGPVSANLKVPPADLTAPHLLAHTEGDLFWFISTGFKAPDGQVVMPAFAAVLPEEIRWDLVDAILARNAGARFAAGTWQPPIRAPNFSVSCGGQSETLADLVGQPVRLLAGADSAAIADARIVRLSGAPDEAADCVATSHGAALAYGLLIGATPKAEFLIDAQGWLRAYWQPENAAALRTRLAAIRAAPIALPAMASGHMH